MLFASQSYLVRVRSAVQSAQQNEHSPLRARDQNLTVRHARTVQIHCTTDPAPTSDPSIALAII